MVLFPQYVLLAPWTQSGIGTSLALPPEGPKAILIALQHHVG